MDMARNLIRRSRFNPDIDIEITFIRLRSGEKLHEELITEGEGITYSTHERIFIVKGENNNDLNWLNQTIEELVELALEQNSTAIKIKLKEFVPGYQPFDMKMVANHSGNT
jgi:FlaA1/EpsC-like NDP-sugar epimerase